MTRRSFGLTVISACVAGSARAGGATTWALSSDTHVSTSSNFNNPGNENLKKVLATIDHRFDGMLICGDNATSAEGDPGQAADYTELKRLVATVKLRKTLFVMGNVDDELEFLKVFGKPADLQKVNSRIVIAVDAGPVRLVVLDSSDGTDFTPGTLGASQLSWLQKYLREHHDKPIILFTHFPADTKITDGLSASCTTPTLGSILVSDPYRSVKAIVSGHEHTCTFSKWANSEIYMLGLPAVAPNWLGTGAPRPFSLPFEPWSNVGWVEATFEKSGFTLTLRDMVGRSSPSSLWPWLR